MNMGKNNIILAVVFIFGLILLAALFSNSAGRSTTPNTVEVTSTPAPTEDEKESPTPEPSEDISPSGSLTLSPSKSPVPSITVSVTTEVDE